MCPGISRNRRFPTTLSLLSTPAWVNRRSGKKHRYRRAGPANLCGRIAARWPNSRPVFANELSTGSGCNIGGAFFSVPWGAVAVQRCSPQTPCQIPSVIALGTRGPDYTVRTWQQGAFPVRILSPPGDVFSISRPAGRSGGNALFRALTPPGPLTSGQGYAAAAGTSIIIKCNCRPVALVRGRCVPYRRG